MEGIFNRLRQQGSTLETTKDYRLPTRPIESSGKGKAFEDFGSTLGAPSQKKSAPSANKPAGTSSKLSTTYARSSSQSSGKSQQTRGRLNNYGVTKSKSITEEPIDISDDEMDLLSSQPDYDDPSTSQKPVRHSRSSSEDDDWDVVVSTREMNSRKKVSESATSKVHTKNLADKQVFNSKFPTQNEVLSKLRFNKIKKPENEEGSSGPPLFDSIENDMDSSKSRAENDDDEVMVYDMPLSAKPTYPNRNANPPSSRTQRHSPGDSIRNKVTAPIHRTENDIQNARPKPRAPLPGRAKLGANTLKSAYGPSGSQTSSRNVLRMVNIDNSSQPKGSQKSFQSRSRSSSLGSSPVRRAKKKSGPDNFPTLSPTSTPVSSQPRKAREFPSLSPLKGYTEQEDTGTAKPKSSISRVPDPFPTLSPPSKKPEQPNAKTRVKSGKGKGKATVIMSTDDDDEDESDYMGPEKQKSRKRDKPEKKLQEFPMATQMLASIGSPRAPATWRSPTGSAKRSSEAGSGDDHRPRKSRRERELLTESPTRQPFDFEGDSISIAAHTDPKTLCPYCDMPLPSSPSPLLRRLLDTTKQKSYKDPRPSNPLGRRAPVTIFITVCQRHRFESEILPEAEKKGWPKTIEWPAVEGRIAKMKESLDALIKDPNHLVEREDSGNEWEVLHTTQNKNKSGPKSRSIFWMEVMDEVKNKGLRSVSGVRGQFANFEKAQPGYYGELGSVIIHQTLYNMFPLAEIDADLVSPLTANEFVQRVLVPEVALRLIVEDQCLEGEEGMRKALTILRDSSAYGVAMFPEDSGTSNGGKKKGDDEEMGVGDLIVMERARKRRKELEEEEEREDNEQRVLDERERELKAKEHQKNREEEKAIKAKLKEKQKKEVDLLASAVKGVVGERPRPRPRPVVRDSSNMNVMRLDDQPQESSRNRSRSRSTHSSMDTDTDASSGTDSLFNIRKDDGRASSEERKRSPSASETRNDAYGNPTPTTRATSRGVASMRLTSDSDASPKAVRAGAGSRAPSRAISRTSTTNKNWTRSEKMAVSENSDSDSIEFLPNDLSPETPVAKKHAPKARAPSIMDEDEATPKPTKAPLERARERKRLALVTGPSEPEPGLGKKLSKPGADGKRSTRTASTLSGFDIHAKYEWLLSESSQSSG